MDGDAFRGMSSTKTFKERFVLLQKAGVQEKVFFHGSNSNGDVFIMEINWQPASGKLPGIISAKLIYKHNGYVYKFEESDSCSPFVECPEDTYRIKGLSVQVVAPFRKSRIIFRGLISRKRLSDGDVEDVFLRLRLFWNPLTKVYDSLSDYNDDFMARELATGRHARKRNFDAIYEDYYEQYSQLKGTLQVESRTVEEVFLWGGRSKSSRQIDGARNTTAIRLLAFSKVLQLLFAVSFCTRIDLKRHAVNATFSNLLLDLNFANAK